MHFFNMRQMHKHNSKKAENEEKQFLIGWLQWHNLHLLQGSILSTFYVQLLHTQIPKA